MHVQLKRGLLIGTRWYPAGEVVDLPADRARALIAGKAAIAAGAANDAGVKPQAEDGASGPGEGKSEGKAEEPTSPPPAGELETSDTAPRKPVRESGRKR